MSRFALLVTCLLLLQILGCGTRVRRVSITMPWEKEASVYTCDPDPGKGAREYVCYREDVAIFDQKVRGDRIVRSYYDHPAGEMQRDILTLEGVIVERVYRAVCNQWASRWVDSPSKETPPFGAGDKECSATCASQGCR